MYSVGGRVTSGSGQEWPCPEPSALKSPGLLPLVLALFWSNKSKGPWGGDPEPVKGLVWRCLGSQGPHGPQVTTVLSQ
jgi:hypothetical protein